MPGSKLLHSTLEYPIVPQVRGLRGAAPSLVVHHKAHHRHSQPAPPAPAPPSEARRAVEDLMSRPRGAAAG